MATLRTTCPCCDVMVDLDPDGVLAVAVDDVLDLHLLLATDTWFDQLAAATRAHQ